MPRMREACPSTTAAVIELSLDFLCVAVNAGHARVDIERIVNDALTAVLFSLQHTVPHCGAPDADVMLVTACRTRP